MSKLPDLPRLLREARRRYIWRAPGQAHYVISFPKCGRTWLRLMLGHYMVNAFDIPDANPIEPEFLYLLSAKAPEIHFVHDDKPHKRAPDALLRDKSSYAGDRVVFMVRDPRDVLVSQYFAMRYRREDDRYQGSIGEFLRERKGSLETIIEYFNIWAINRDVPLGFLLVRYEEMHRDPAAALSEVLSFVGISQIDNAQVDRTVDFCAFERMRRLEEQDAFKSRVLRPGDSDNPQSFKTRSGQIGDHKNWLQGDDLAYADAIIRERLDPFFGY